MLWQPFNRKELERIQREMDRLLESPWLGVQRLRRRTFPAINVWINEAEGVIVTAELPGVNADALDISVTGDTLTLGGERPISDEVPAEQYHRRERQYGSFSRTVQLPFTVDAGKVEATMKRGVLQISLPRAEAEKPKQIPVTVA